MNKSNASQVAARARAYYDQALRVQLEAEHQDEFVAIEPVSGEYFLGRTLSEAVAAARQAHPGRLSQAMRVGHVAAVHLGAGQ